MSLKKLLSLGFLIAFLLAFSPRRVLAQEFLFDYDVYYTVSDRGATRVRQNITITNQETNVYAQNYTLTLPTTEINSISASDALGSIDPLVTQNEGQTTITVPFNQKVVGRDNQLYFNLSYQHDDVVRRFGRIKEVIISGVESKQDIHSYQVHLSVPDSWGKPAYLTPSPNQDGVWTMNELLGGGVTAGYGDYQNFRFELIYQLQNPLEQKAMDVITLPPDTAFQKVIYDQISRHPENTTIDNDGNWLAEIALEPNERVDVILTGNVLVYIRPDNDTTVILDDEQIESYTKQLPFWNHTDKIMQKANELATAKNIYDYVVDTLTYDYSRVSMGIERLGAIEAYDHPQHAVCMEFSDLFVALARATGIPAREIHGFAYTTNTRLQPLSLVSDILHAWPEYYDKSRQMWIPVDPTWGNTRCGLF